MVQSTDHWGKWIEERARFLGLNSRASLARAMKLSERHVNRLVDSAKPPRLQKKTMDALSRVLCMSDVYVRSGHLVWPPDEIPVVGELATQHQDKVDVVWTNIETEHCREIEHWAKSLHGRYLFELLQAAVRLAVKQVEDRERLNPSEDADVEHSPDLDLSLEPLIQDDQQGDQQQDEKRKSG